MEHVTLDRSTATLNVGGTLTLEPYNATNQLVRWTSSNTAVARVNEKGIVTALAPGTVTIIVTTENGGFTATCTVTVIKQ